MRTLHGAGSYSCSGFEFGRRAVRGITASMDECIARARIATEGMSREELVKFIGEMVYSIACIKQEIVNEKLFGVDPRR